MIPRDRFIETATSAAIVSCIVVGLTDIVSWQLVAKSYDPISQTISDLAVGSASWLLDFGLWVFAAGCLAQGLAMLLQHGRRPSWVLAGITVML
ncbi:DUF998 domain-containing protein, partial [Loktanella sp. DJP18]|uniref:DUF998 domain-containing protein n=1 Tax=Loktanella sp. DJP18 TaxID=3409788 RepID=UPI003BB7AFED